MICFYLFQIKLNSLRLRSKINQEKILFTFFLTFTHLQMSSTNGHSDCVLHLYKSATLSSAIPAAFGVTQRKLQSDQLTQMISLGKNCFYLLHITFCFDWSSWIYRSPDHKWSVNICTKRHCSCADQLAVWKRECQCLSKGYNWIPQQLSDSVNSNHPESDLLGFHNSHLHPATWMGVGTLVLKIIYFI